MFEAHCVPFLLQLWGQSVLPGPYSWVQQRVYKKRWSITVLLGPLIWGMWLTQVCSELELKTVSGKEVN